jgi:hypothetical protein
MKLRSHIVASVIFSSIFFLVFKSWSITVSSFISGVLIDIDHVLDYFWEFRKRFNVKEFFDVHHNDKILFFMVILHSWELLALLSICAYSMSWNPWIVGVTLGFTQHIILDQIFNDNPVRLKYFFFWRLKNDFDVKKMVQID